MLFKNLPTPGGDEVLSSWLFRCSFNRGIKGFKRFDLYTKPESWWEGLDLQSLDPDVDFLAASKRFELGSRIAQVETMERYFSFSKCNVIDWKYRRFFCSDCLRDDIANGQLPVWRKNWCYEHSSICITHGRALSTLLDASRYSKAWDAFAQICNFASNGEAPIRWKIGDGWSSVVSRIENALICVDRRNKTMRQELFEKLFCIFLQMPYKGSFGGVARIHFYLERGVRFAEPDSLERSFLCGPSTADPYSRLGGVMLAAALLGSLPLSRFELFTKIFEDRRSGAVLPKDFHRAASFPSLDRSGYQSLRSFLGIFPREEFPLLDRHLRIQEDRYIRDGAFDGQRLGSSPLSS